MNAVENYAKTLGLAVDWNPGLYPLLSNGKDSFHLED
jgi:hypothetical protein